MSAMGAAQRSAFEVLLPTNVGWSAVRILSITTAAQAFDLNALWGQGAATPARFVHQERLAKGASWVRIAARGGTLWVRGRADTGPLTLTAGPAAEGQQVGDGAYEDFYISAALPFLEIIGSAAMSAAVHFSSHNAGNLEPTP